MSHARRVVGRAWEAMKRSVGIRSAVYLAATTIGLSCGQRGDTPSLARSNGSSAALSAADSLVHRFALEVGLVGPDVRWVSAIPVSGARRDTIVVVKGHRSAVGRCSRFAPPSDMNLSGRSIVIAAFDSVSCRGIAWIGVVTYSEGKGMDSASDTARR